MLLLHLKNRDILGQLAHDLAELAKQHGLQSPIAFRLMPNLFEYLYLNSALCIVSYNTRWKEIILWEQNFENYERRLQSTVESIWPGLSLPPEQLANPTVKEDAVRYVLIVNIAHALAHEIKHQIDSDRYPRFFRASNICAGLWRRPQIYGTFLERPLKLLYRFNPTEIRANRYALRYAKEYQAILDKYL